MSTKLISTIKTGRTVKLLSFVLMLILCINLFPAAALAADETAKVLYSGKCGTTATYSLTEDGVLTVSGTGNIGVSWSAFDKEGKDYGDSYTRWNNIVKKVVIEEGITGITQNTFANFLAMTEVSIPSTVTTIRDAAFASCTALTKVTIPATVTTIDQTVFGYCENLTEVNYESSAPVSTWMFKGCTSLETVTLNDKITSIGEKAFTDCTALKQIVLPESIKSIGNSAFENCTALESIELPRTLTNIGTKTFKNCSNLKSITIPAISNIGTEAFKDCSSLSDVFYPGSRETFRKISAGSGNDGFFAAKVHPYHNYTYIPFCTVTTKYTRYGYTGNQIKPSVSVTTLSGTKLKKGTNYTVRYENNTKCGTATIIITGIGRYTGELKYTFQIVPAKIKGLKVTEINGRTATIKWEKNSSVTGYQVGLLYTPLVKTTKLSAVLTNLSKGTHKIYVRGMVNGTDENGSPVTYYGNASMVEIVIK